MKRAKGASARWTVGIGVLGLALGLVVAGCGEDDDAGDASSNNSAANNSAANNNTGNNDPEPDAGGGDEDTGEDDNNIPTVGDVGSIDEDGCDEIAARADAWPLHAAVSDGGVEVTEASGVWTAVIDAAAGGSQASAGKPFVYVDLDGGAKVAVTDLAAGREDVTWELAFRRTSIFANGGDAGPGAVEVARLTGADFDAVGPSDIPADAAFAVEASVDGFCETIPTPSGFGSVISVMELLNPNTNSGSWFDYSAGAGGAPRVLPYPDHVYIVRSTDQGKTYKLSIVSWESGVTTLKWAEL